VLLSSGDNFPHLIQKRRSQLGFVTYLLNYPRIIRRDMRSSGRWQLKLSSVWWYRADALLVSDV